MLEKQKNRYRRHKRIRAKVRGTSERPRLCVFRSLKHTYCQIIDDEKGRVLLSAKDSEVSPSKESFTKFKNKRKVVLAYELGRLIAEKAIKKKIQKVVFDRGGYKYHGRVKALAEGAREGGLQF